MKHKTKLQEIEDKITVEKSHLRKDNDFVCDHKVRTPNGMVMGFRFICEICGKDLTK